MQIYIHVPFCRRRCAYCAFHSQAIGYNALPESYLEGILAEIALFAELLPQEQRRVSTLFFGGGTPSLLSPKMLSAILDTVDASFLIEKDAELSLEGNPDSLKLPHRLQGFREAGITRISLGVQSMQSHELLRLGRIHSLEDVFFCIEEIRKCGFASLNLDFMWGLPEQSLEDWLSTLEKALVLQPDHLSAYALSLEEGTPLWKQDQRTPLAFPDEELARAMYLEGSKVLEGHGLFQYEISNYARKGYACRHNLGYWQGRDYIGLGPAAVSTLADQRWTNTSDFSTWYSQVSSHQFAHSIEHLDPATSLREKCMLALRTCTGMQGALYSHVSARPAIASFFAALSKEGLLSVKENACALTREGMLVSNAIIEQLFELL